MSENHTYTLAELALETGLTERTVRYYIEQVLPPHHKQGRGKLALYGLDTLNCIRFIVLVDQRYGFKPGQAKGVLANVPQETIDRVVRGEEELTVMTVPITPTPMKPGKVDRLPRSSERMAKAMLSERSGLRANRPTGDRLDLLLDAEMYGSHSESEPASDDALVYSLEEFSDPWRIIFANEQVRIQYRGDSSLTSLQQEQIETAARLIELALK